MTGCLLCELEAAAPDTVVFRDGLWAAEVAPGYEVPGWFFLRVRRHAGLRPGHVDPAAAVALVPGVRAAHQKPSAERIPPLPSPRPRTPSSADAQVT